MKESYWGYWLIVLGVFVILIMLLVQNVTATNTQDYYLAKEIAEASMIDAVDYGYYREYGEVRIIKEKFVESFVRRFAESASLSSTYKIEFYEIYEVPPKVSVKISTNSSSFNIAGDSSTFKIVNKIDMILEADPTFTYPESIDDGNFEIASSALKSIPGTKRYVTKTGDNEYTIVDNTGQIFDKNCKVLTATFDKSSADNISYDLYKCIPDSSGKCDIFLPQIYKADGNVYGWNTTSGSKNNTLTPGSKVTITKDTTYYAVTDSSIVTVDFKFITPTTGVKNLSASNLSCVMKTNQNSCQITLPTVTADTGYKFNGWSTSQTGSTGLVNPGTSVTIYRNDSVKSRTYYAILEKVAQTPSTDPTQTPTTPTTPTPTPTPTVTDEVDYCNFDNIYVGENNMKVGDVKDATAWPQYTKVTLYNDKNKAAKTVTAGTPMRVISCDSTYCKVWVKGDDCKTSYKIQQSKMLINLPDYIPTIVYGGHTKDVNASKKRRGFIYNKKVDADKPIVPTRMVMAKKLVKVVNTLAKKKYRLYINDLYRPVSAQSNPNVASNPYCKYVSCGISYHAFAGAVDASLAKYDSSSKTWKQVTIKPEIGNGGTKAHVSSVKTGSYESLYKILSSAMTGAGLKVYEYEWWHYNDPTAISDRNTANNNKSAWATKKETKWGTKTYIFDVKKIDKSSSYKHVNFLPKLYYED